MKKQQTTLGLYLKNSLLLCVGMLLITACSADDLGDYRREIGPGITNYGERNADLLKQKMTQLAQGGNQVLTVTQFGDSHSAADFFTGGLRDHLQSRLGNAGIGWVTPMSVRGQRSAEVTWKSQRWDLASSRTVSDQPFAMGGYRATPNRVGATIDVLLEKPEQYQGLWDARLVVQAPNSEAFAISNDRGRLNLENALVGNGSWKQLRIRTSMPFRIEALDRNIALGGLWLQRSGQPGAIVSSIATNGAQLSIWDRWSPEWITELVATQSDLVILEYGTNEAFNDTLDRDDYKRQLVKSIRTIRQQLPNAAILLMSPPDALMQNKQGSCSGKYPPSYEMVKSVQLAVAKSERLLFWDWQKAMGGRCSIEKWQKETLAGRDKVHLSAAGYRLSAKMFYKDLMQFAGLRH